MPEKLVGNFQHVKNGVPDDEAEILLVWSKNETGQAFIKWSEDGNSYMFHLGSYEYLNVEYWMYYPEGPYA